MSGRHVGNDNVSTPPAPESSNADQFRFSANNERQRDQDQLSSNSSELLTQTTPSEISSSSSSATQNDTKQILKDASSKHVTAKHTEIGGAKWAYEQKFSNDGEKYFKTQHIDKSSNALGSKLHSPQQNPQQQQQSIKLLLILFLIGLIVCVSSLSCILMLPTIVSNQIAKKLVLKNNSMLLERWSKPNVPMFFKVWLFDIKNAQEIIDRRDTKPIVSEIGPFVFNLKRKKDVISFAGDNLYYTERKVFHFNRELSCCAINTTVTIPNIPLVAVVDRALAYNLPLVGRFIPRLINRAIQSLREQLFVRKQVREILFDGYDVELLRMVSRVGSLVGLPQQSQKFALLKGRNDSWRPEQDGVWAINTGQRNRHQFGRVASWNSYKRLPFWPAPQCNVINGSDGTLFPPPIKRTEPLYIFNQELCRTVNLVYDKPSDVRSISALRFVLNPLNFAHTMTPSNRPPKLLPSATASANLLPTLPLVPPSTSVGAPAPAGPPLLPLAQSAASWKPSGQLRALENQVHASRPAFRERVNSLPSQGDKRATTITSSPETTSAAFKPPFKSRGPQVLLPAGSGAGSRLTKPTGVASNQLMTSASELQSLADIAPRRAQGTSTPERQQQLPSQTSNGKQVDENIEIRQQQERLIQAAQDEQLASERRSPMNPQTCFCDRKTTNLNGVNVCEFDGLIDLSKCSKQAQVIFGSMPHFYNSDARLLRQVVGMQPNASKHSTYLDIEPVSFSYDSAVMNLDGAD